MQYTNLYSYLLFFLFFTHLMIAQDEKHIEGKVTDVEGKPLFGVNIWVPELSNGTTTDSNGEFYLKASSAEEVNVHISFIGYVSENRKINFTDSSSPSLNIQLIESKTTLDEVNLSAKGRIQQIEALAYNVDVIDAKKLKHTSLDIGHALDRVSGVRIRENGGVGSDMQLSMNGFNGNQVKLFIDGIPMEHFGSSFQINNIPIGLADRVEVYKGVVPVNLGADALGGAVNIVTNTYEKDHLDVSYSYGSFNTHRSNILATHVTESDFVFHFNAFQNYSDNNYDVLVETADIYTGENFPQKRIERFHDQFRNETLIGKFGVVNKSYADELLLGVTLGQNYNEVQNGARLAAVYGGRHTRGNIIMPSLSYKKDDFLKKGLDVKINANYNLGKEKIIDTLSRRYNWLRQYKETERGGELNYQHQELQNNNGVVTFSADYEINKYHRLSVSNVYTTFDREQQNFLNQEEEDYDQPQKTFKNVAGLSYIYESGDWNILGFAKNYNQVVKFSRLIRENDFGGGETYYQNFENKENYFGFGAAATYFFSADMQVKASYENTYRLPLPFELFGDANLIQGNLDLKPENSHNYNLGASYWVRPSEGHLFNFETNFFYRDADDFIRRTLAPNQSRQTTENVPSMNNYGIEAQVRYDYQDKFRITANLTHQEMRNNNPESSFYRSRIPNMPFTYGNANANYNFKNVVSKDDVFSLGYDLLYVHPFYLYWPIAGDKAQGKYDIPEQMAHGFNATLTIDHFQFTLECRNILDEVLYDNFSLQKPGRSFTAKIRYTL